MPQVKVNDCICEYISHEDFERLVTEPGLLESDVCFKESKTLNDILAEFGL